MSYQVFTLADKDCWQKFVSNSVFYDFYHTWIYHSLERNGVPKLFVYSEGEKFIAVPLLVRKVFDTEYFDITSAYGYVGPISNVRFEMMPEPFLNNFKSSFLNYLECEKIISVFFRLHPFMNQDVLLEKFNSLHSNGKTVVLDLQVSLEDQRTKYRRTIRENINQLRKKGYYVKEANDLKSVRDFVSIYSENMRRIGADDYYFFNEDYFIKLLESSEIDSKLLLVYSSQHEAICGTLVTCTNKIIQGHLIGTKTNYLKESPAKLLVEEISILGRANNMNYYHLGGGVGGGNDSLFNWKAGFSNEFLEFKTWRFIADENSYNFFVDNMNISPDSSDDFFPLYRAKKTSLKAQASEK
ncbi:MAG: GNAT family N-acetyltransferase [Pyrinomonadaceae bacterium]|nr:GNAT family N-acetyltransferase [Sphingobacteriaceae bacterium]